MDNIQKSVIAVLCVAAFAALIIPSGNSFDSKPTVAPVEPAIAPQPDIVAVETPSEEGDEDSDEYASEDEGVEEQDEFATFGQPMNDAMPLGSNGNSGNVESAQTNLPAGAFDGSQPAAPPQQGQYVAGAQVTTN